ncbi:hypothetical protein A1OO_04295 [Enterovibrio norvegicus FF-33]|nr:hypothetical protein [Enterovibrio norvegicus]OEE70004.1 hypothetical protein A1OO_04295 [Enterovibrio norvegicus FF-33]
MKTNMLAFLVTSALLSFTARGEYSGTATVIEGSADVKVENLYICENGRSRPSPIGEKQSDGQTFVVPADVQYEEQKFATNLYDQCSNVKPGSLADVDVSAVPVVEVDSDGEIVTGYIFADNYFELYINGTLIGVDPVPFTPFNSNIVRFKVNKPYDIAIKVVDWEENSGLGSENNRGKRYHAGDGGLIASFTDGTKTNGDWSAQTFYTSPITDLNCVEENGQHRITATCDTDGSDSYVTTYSLHWGVPDGWKANEQFEAWPKATEFTEDDIGVNNKKAYMNFQEQFTGSGAKFIWSKNLVLDNLVLFRYSVK